MFYTVFSSYHRHIIIFIIVLDVVIVVCCVWIDALSVSISHMCTLNHLRRLGFMQR